LELGEQAGEKLIKFGQEILKIRSSDNSDLTPPKKNVRKNKKSFKNPVEKLIKFGQEKSGIFENII